MKIRSIPILAIALACGASFASPCRGQAATPGAMKALGTGQIAPAFSLTDLGGKTLDLAAYRGRVVLLDFWATWCAPCREEMPAFARLRSRWAARNVEFVGLANDDPAKVERFARELAIDYPLLTGGADVDELARRLGDAQGLLPFTVVLDPGGAVLAQKVGAYTEVALDQELDRAMASMAGNKSPTSANSK